MYRYRQRSTGQVVERPEPWESAEASEDWELTLDEATEQPEDEPTVDEVTDPDDAEEEVEDLEGLTRPVLNERATALGVEAPEELPNRTAVIEAIEAATEQEATDE